MSKYQYIGIFISYCAVILCGCGEKPETEQTSFTKVDSLTDTYLTLQDSILEVWNEMISDDNQKIASMYNTLHELRVSGSVEQQILESYEERLNQLRSSRYTQKTMGNADIVQEYDFASNTLVTELISLAEAQPQFAYNTTLQKLVDEIRLADQRVNNYRYEYDRITSIYNRFIEQHKDSLTEVNMDSFLVEKPLFQMVAEE